MLEANTAPVCSTKVILQVCVSMPMSLNRFKIQIDSYLGAQFVLCLIWRIYLTFLSIQAHDYKNDLAKPLRRSFMGITVNSLCISEPSYPSSCRS